MARAPARIIAVGGARDGVGKSSFVVNAAMSLRKETQASVLIVEADPEGAGDISALLGMKPGRGVVELEPYLAKLDTKAMSQQIGVHSTGVGFLPLAVEPGAARGAGQAPVRLRGGGLWRRRQPPERHHDGAVVGHLPDGHA